MPEYASPSTDAGKATKLVKAATVCGAAPLAFGCLIFLIWVPSRSAALELGGLVNIFFGLCCVAIGSILLLAHLLSIRGPRRFSRFFKSSWLALLLLFINFPVAIVIIMLVGSIMSAHRF
jgi:hypothetical protein